MAVQADMLRRLGEIVGPENAGGDGVVRPATAEQAAAVLKLAGEHRVRVAPIGGGTQRDLGNAGQPCDLFISTARMNAIIEYEPADLTASVQAGVTAAQFDEASAPNRQWLPLGVARPSRATIGGIIATNSSGPYRLFYGTARDMVIGMKLVTADGRVVKTGGMVVKNVAGYDVAKLMIGSLGTLALITGVNFKVFPRPATETTVMAFRELGKAMRARNAILSSPVTPLALDLFDQAAATLIAPQEFPPGAYLLAAEYGGVPPVIERCRRELETMARGEGTTAIATLAGDQEQRAWNAVCDFPADMATHEPDSARVKISTTIQGIQPLLETVSRLAAEGSADLAVVARAGSGICYFYLKANNLGGLLEAVTEAAKAAGAYAVIEYAPAAVKSRFDVWGPRRDDHAAMSHLKQAFDPNAILNPGRFLC